MSERVSGIKHPAFRDALALTRTAGRQAIGRYLVEDEGMVRQALAADGALVRGVFATVDAASRLSDACRARGVTLYALSSGLIHKLVGTGYETAVEVVAVVEQRRVEPEALLSGSGLVLCGESIQDPRNVGVLVRTADALGCSGLLLSLDSAEPYQRAAVRSTTGSILRLALSLAPDLPAVLQALRAAGATVVASSGGAGPLASERLSGALRPLVLVVGNEQSGISAATRAASDHVVRLPMAPGTQADSLNVTVAAGILLYDALR